MSTTQEPLGGDVGAVAGPVRPTDAPSWDVSPIEGPLRNLQPLVITLVSTPYQEQLWDHLIGSFHYLGRRALVGERIKYLVHARDDRLLAALGWASPVWKLKARDLAVGWSPAVRQRHLHLVANNNRFLILPWARVPHLASHILARVARRISDDWVHRHGHPLALLETFVDPARFTGACYRAANWIPVGSTRGFAKDGRSFQFHGHPKEVFLYALTPRFRQLLGVHRPDLPRLSHAWIPPSPPGGNPMPVFLGTQTPPPLHIVNEDFDAMIGELKNFHALFKDCWGRLEQEPLSAAYLQGLLSGIDRKSVEPIALRTLGESRVTSLQKFIGSMRWDDCALERRHKEEAAQTLSDPAGVFSVDGSDFPKKGLDSVGVARQYCGRLGKVDNCQAGVFLAYAAPLGHALLDRRLFLPQHWFSKEQRARRKKCRIPEDVRFRTKPQLALEMVREIVASGLFRGRWVTCDDAFGNSPDFVDHLPAGLFALADVPSTTRVWRTRPRLTTPAYDGFGRPPSITQLAKGEPSARAVAAIAKDKNIDWRFVTLGDGAKGPRRALVARLRVVVSRDKLPAHDAWLFLKKSIDSGEVKYSLSNAPQEISFDELIRVSSLRWPVEQCFQEGKSEIGMDHYEHRSWPAWHRHMTFAFLAQLFLLRLRLRLKKKPPL
jgi:SRSO17 transposase